MNNKRIIFKKAENHLANNLELQLLNAHLESYQVLGCTGILLFLPSNYSSVILSNCQHVNNW